MANEDRYPFDPAIDAKQGVTILDHYNDCDVFNSSLTDFQQEVMAASLNDRIHYLQHGETYQFQATSKRVAA